VQRKMDTYYHLTDLGLGDYLVPCREFFDDVGSVRWAQYILDTYGSVGIRADFSNDIDHLSRGVGSYGLPCYPHLDMEGFVDRSKTLFKSGMYSLLVYYSPGMWLSQGVVGLFDDRLVVELDGHGDKNSICRFYDQVPFLAAYDGNWAYQGPHKRTIQKIMDVLLSRDLCNVYVEFTEFEDLGLILWQLRDWNKRLPERVGRTLKTNNFDHYIF